MITPQHTNSIIAAILTNGEYCDTEKHSEYLKNRAKCRTTISYMQEIKSLVDNSDKYNACLATILYHAMFDIIDTQVLANLVIEHG